LAQVSADEQKCKANIKKIQASQSEWIRKDVAALSYQRFLKTFGKNGQGNFQSRQISRSSTMSKRRSPDSYFETNDAGRFNFFASSTWFNPGSTRDFL